MKQLNFRRCPFPAMHKNELRKSYIIATVAIAGFLLLSVTTAGIQFSHQAYAQGGTSMTNNEQFNAAASNNTSSSSPTTGASPSSTVTPNQLPQTSTTGTSSSGASTQNEPPLNRNVVWQGFLSSKLSTVPGHEKDHVATILAPRGDNGVYSGILTFSASKPVKVVVWNVVTPENKTAIPKQFGTQSDLVKLGGKTVSLTTLGSSEKSGSVPFTGNAIELLNSGGGKNKDFTATYSINVVGTQGQTVNNLQSIAAAATAANATGPSSSGSNTTGSSK